MGKPNYALASVLPALLISTSLSANPYATPDRTHPGYQFQPRQPMAYSTPWSHRGAHAFAPRQQTEAPAQIIREGLGKLEAFLSSGESRDTNAVNHYLALEIAPYFDLEYMTRWAAGPLYRRLSPDQRMALAKGLGQLFFRNMATHLAGYQGGNISYLPNPSSAGRETTVRVQVGGVDRPPVRIDFRMYRNEDGWKVFDVQAGGRSAVVHYRNLLANMSRQAGVQGMLNQLASL